MKLPTQFDPHQELRKRPPGPGLSRRSRGMKPGFSLMEVTIALAIVAITCIPLIGMLPVGLNTMREGQKEAIEAEIVRLLTNELSMSNWSDTSDLEDFEANNDGERYFDTVGVPLEEDAKVVAFTAKIIVHDPVTLPGAAQENRFLKRIEIRITDKPAQVDERFTNERLHRVHSLLIAKMDK